MFTTSAILLTSGITRTSDVISVETYEIRYETVRRAFRSRNQKKLINNENDAKKGYRVDVLS